jgi:hypothetical protein
MCCLYVVYDTRRNSSVKNGVDVRQCPLRQSTGDYELYPRMKALRRGQRLMSGFSGLWGNKDALANKQELCGLSNKLRQKQGVDIAPPCFQVPSSGP